MSHHRQYFQTKDRLISVLESAITLLAARVQAPHRFRFVSHAQAAPYATAFSKWEQAGRSGPQPTAPIAEIRAAIYDQADSASKLKAFCKVASVTAVELAEVARDGLNSDRVVVTYTALRGFIERVAHTTATGEALKDIKRARSDGPLTPVLELSEVIHKTLYGTHREWSKLVRADFRKTSVKEVKYVKKPDAGSPIPESILNSVDTLNKRIPGARLVYEILCEFLHPNVGDLFGATLEADISIDAFGTRHLSRTIGFGPKTYEGLPELQVVNEKLLDVCADIVPQMQVALDEIDSIAKIANGLTRRFAHGYVRGERSQFSPLDPCPCLSGQSVSACTGLRFDK